MKGVEQSIFRRDFKILGVVGELGQKDKLRYQALIGGCLKPLLEISTQSLWVQPQRRPAAKVFLRNLLAVAAPVPAGCSEAVWLSLILLDDQSV